MSRTEHHQMIQQQRLPIQPPFSSPYSNLLVTEYFSILDLAPFTGLRLGATTLSFFTKDPSNIIRALSSSVPGSQKFLSFIFPRYGQALTLSLAVDCIVVKVQQMIMDVGSTFAHNIVLRQHTRVLECIQQDLNDRSQWMSSETLCAIQLLGLFDLINNASLQSWLCHVAGASRLIEQRGARNFKSDFDLAILTAQIGPIITEAILDNRHCFLTDESWKTVICESILSDEYFYNYRDIVTCLWTHLVWGPNHFKLATDMISAMEAPTPQEYTALIKDMISHNESLLCLTDLLQQRLAAADNRSEIVPGSKGSQVNPLEIEGTLIICRLMKLRLLFALDPARFSAMEAESQNLASQVMYFDEQLGQEKEGRIMGGLFMSQTTWIARATIETYDVWKTEVGSEGMIAKWKFEAWCCAMGRRINV
ncbi:uncharacterized protein TrAtP1_012394 [Trichoderma atroviride]|nr:hypothetical protein TrAtP1_012394 [Trichoderma atroviride]